LMLLSVLTFIAVFYVFLSYLPSLFFLTVTSTTVIYTLSLHDALPIWGLFDLEKMSVDIQEYSERMAEPGFWDDPQKAQQVIDESNDIKNKYDSFMKLSDEVEEYQLMLEMVEETGDEDLNEELNEGIQQLHKETEDFELIILLSEPYDRNNAILELNPGAGGTESQDFGEMLLRMYTRWNEHKGFSYEIIDYQDGEEAGIK